MKAKHEMTKSSTPAATIVLKTLHDDIMRDNPNSTLTTKRMRVWLRANMRDSHDHNASWLFTQSQYDTARSHFDPAYRAKLERAAKRNAKSPAATTRKRRAKTNDVLNVETTAETA